MGKTAPKKDFSLNEENKEKIDAENLEKTDPFKSKFKIEKTGKGTIELTATETYGGKTKVKYNRDLRMYLHSLP